MRPKNQAEDDDNATFVGFLMDNMVEELVLAEDRVAARLADQAYAQRPRSLT